MTEDKTTMKPKGLFPSWSFMFTGRLSEMFDDWSLLVPSTFPDDHPNHKMSITCITSIKPLLGTQCCGLDSLLLRSHLPRWNSCKQNKQPANNHQATAANQTVTPEGEKLHSDSGISVDSQSLQEQQHAAQVQTQTHRQEQIGELYNTHCTLS